MTNTNCNWNLGRRIRERTTSNNDTGSGSGLINYQFTAGDWVKLMITNTSDNDDPVIVSCDWKIEYDE